MKKELFGRLSSEEFEVLKNKYQTENSQFNKSLIFHVGTGAGLYSELGAMLESMCYCHANKVQFRRMMQTFQTKMVGMNFLSHLDANAIIR